MCPNTDQLQPFIIKLYYLILYYLETLFYNYFFLLQNHQIYLKQFIFLWGSGVICSNCIELLYSNLSRTKLYFASASHAIGFYSSFLNLSVKFSVLISGKY